MYHYVPIYPILSYLACAFLYCSLYQTNIFLFSLDPISAFLSRVLHTTARHYIPLYQHHFLARKLYPQTFSLCRYCCYCFLNHSLRLRLTYLLAYLLTALLLLLTKVSTRIRDWVSSCIFSLISNRSPPFLFVLSPSSFYPTLFNYLEPFPFDCV
ncbi:hypothetical protein K435DRAFT_212846 [Dendrothele bispora CBS 962.96]|uniref:Uncharacterized protein n=1 Tax=Dendrothele bispora (strain CBS 962.96) TaxID=1314807 RepID=A0A4S8LS00_DENBC|nr:hypothetical protein K435DRAFT_212846 [Dendrothele bispora CBS 962.96]